MDKRSIPDQQGVLLQEYGIDPAQAAELRASLTSFAEDWNQPLMDIYDDYKAAKARPALAVQRA